MSRVTQLMARARVTAPAPEPAPGSDAALLAEALAVLRVLYDALHRVAPRAAYVQRTGELIRAIERRTP